MPALIVRPGPAHPAMAIAALRVRVRLETVETVGPLVPGHAVTRGCAQTVRPAAAPMDRAGPVRVAMLPMDLPVDRGPARRETLRMASVVPGARAVVRLGATGLLQSGTPPTLVPVPGVVGVRPARVVRLGLVVARRVVRFGAVRMIARPGAFPRLQSGVRWR